MRIRFQVGFMWMLTPDWIRIRCTSRCPCEQPLTVLRHHWHFCICSYCHNIISSGSSPVFLECTSPVYVSSQYAYCRGLVKYQISVRIACCGHFYNIVKSLPLRETTPLPGSVQILLASRCRKSTAKIPIPLPGLVQISLESCCWDANLIITKFIKIPVPLPGHKPQRYMQVIKNISRKWTAM